MNATATIHTTGVSDTSYVQEVKGKAERVTWWQVAGLVLAAVIGAAALAWAVLVLVLVGGFAVGLFNAVVGILLRI
ncbi:MAG: hypothetical protein HY678_08610 [Chloroflexi bacterium]|nr:hypothetical protein [Chloroflexota bacterium]